MKNVIVVIPIYKDQLSFLEKIALEQVKYILKRYDMVFIAPYSIECTYVSNGNVICLDDKYFSSREMYSELLMSKEFYEIFIDYKYLLIYQLDAFVFKDILESFCSMNYDYIGAPMTGGDWSKFHVGNGGLSLRNVKKSLAMVREKEKIKKRMFKLMDFEYFAEDVFFSYCGYDELLDYTVPSPCIARTFSVTTDYVQGLRRISKHGLPFGCHYWHKFNYDFWKPYIERYGYKLPNNKSHNSLLSDTYKRLEYLCTRYILNKKWEVENDTFSFIINRNKYLSVYGAGEWGKKCIKFLHKFTNKIIINIYDSNITGEMMGIPIVYGESSEIKKKNSFIIIATPKYEKDIGEMLNSWGLIEFEDYACMSKMIYKSYGLLR